MPGFTQPNQVQTSGTYTGPGGAGQNMLASAANPYTTTITAPPPQPTVQQQPGTQQTSLQGPTDLSGSQGYGADAQALAQQRANLVDQLFTHDQGLASKYADPNSPDYIANPAQREQVSYMPATADTKTLQTMNSIISSLVGKAKLTPAEQKQQYTQQLTDDLAANPNASLNDVINAYRPTGLPVNDIIDTYQSMNPGAVPLTEAQKYGYKPSAETAAAQKQYTMASQAMTSIDMLDKLSKQAARLWTGWTQIPGLAPYASRIDPTLMTYMDTRNAQALPLMKALLGLSYPGGATMMLGYLPLPTDSEETRQAKIAQLYQLAQARMDDASTNAGGFALGAGGGAANTAYAPTASAPTAQAPLIPGQVTTSAGAYSYQPSPSTTAMGQ